MHVTDPKANSYDKLTKTFETSFQAFCASVALVSLVASRALIYNDKLIQLSIPKKKKLLPLLWASVSICIIVVNSQYFHRGNESREALLKALLFLYRKRDKLNVWNSWRRCNKLRVELAMQGNFGCQISFKLFFLYFVWNSRVRQNYDMSYQLNYLWLSGYKTRL